MEQLIKQSSGRVPGISQHKDQPKPLIFIWWAWLRDVDYSYSIQYTCPACELGVQLVTSRSLALAVVSVIYQVYRDKNEFPTGQFLDKCFRSRNH